MIGTPRRGFYFWKIHISKIVGHAHFEEIALLLIFSQNVHPDTQRDSQEALRRLCEAISVSKALKQLWKQ